MLLAAAPLRAQVAIPRVKLDLDSLRTATAGDSDDAVVQYRVALAFWDRKKYDEADSVLRRAIRLAPQYAEARLAFSLLPVARGEGYYRKVARHASEDSMRALLRSYSEASRRAFLLDPGVDLSVLLREEDDVLPSDPVVVFRTRSGDIRFYVNEWWYKPLRKGVKELIEGRPDTAFATLNAVLDAKEMKEGGHLPSQFIWWYAIAAFHVRNYDRAVAAIRTLLQRATDQEAANSLWSPPQARADFQYLLATGLFLGGALDIADTAFRSALDLDLGLYMAHVQLARIAEARGDWTGAAIERQRAIDANPEEGGLYADLGGTLLHAGRQEAAESAFAQATQLAPSDPRTWYLLGVSAQGNGHDDVARGALGRFLAIAPSRYADLAEDARARLTHLPSGAQ
jgi:tetratricopeptide (TPR) repeat protein